MFVSLCQYHSTHIRSIMTMVYYRVADKSLARPGRKQATVTRRFWVSYILFIIIIGGILVLFIYITRLASNEIFWPSNKIHGEVGRVKDVSAPLYFKKCDCFFVHCPLEWVFSVSPFPSEAGDRSSHWNVWLLLAWDNGQCPKEQSCLSLHIHILSSTTDC